MFINFTDTHADSKGIKNGTLLKFIFDNSETQATLVLVFPDFKTFKKDHDNLAGPIIESMRKQGLKVELNDGERNISISPSNQSFEVTFALNYENNIIGNLYISWGYNL